MSNRIGVFSSYLWESKITYNLEKNKSTDAISIAISILSKIYYLDKKNISCSLYTNKTKAVVLGGALLLEGSIFYVRSYLSQTDGSFDKAMAAGTYLHLTDKAKENVSRLITVATLTCYVAMISFGSPVTGVIGLSTYLLAALIHKEVVPEVLGKKGSLLLDIALIASETLNPLNTVLYKLLTVTGLSLNILVETLFKEKVINYLKESHRETEESLTKNKERLKNHENKIQSLKLALENTSADHEIPPQSPWAKELEKTMNETQSEFLTNEIEENRDHLSQISLLLNVFNSPIAPINL